MNKTPGAPDAMNFALNAFRPPLEFRVIQCLGSLGAFKGQCGYNRYHESSTSLLPESS